MRFRSHTYLVLPLLVLGIGCADQLVTDPARAPDAVFARAGGGGAYDAILLGGGNGWATAINDAGTIVGFAREGRDGSAPNPALRWVASGDGVSGPEVLGTLPAPFEDAFRQWPTAINNNGMIVGNATGRVNGSQRDGAFVFTDQAGMLLLPWFVGDTYEHRAEDLNDRGFAVGSIIYALRDDEQTVVAVRRRAALWLNLQDRPIVLPPLDGHDASYARAISMNGLIVGDSWTHGEPLRTGVAWQINDAGDVTEGPYALGMAPRAVNNSGDILGSQIDSNTGIINWSLSTVMRAGYLLVLGGLPNHTYVSARAISDATAAGIVQVAGESEGQPVVWTIDAANLVSEPMEPGLPSNNSTGAQLHGINGHGWIVGLSSTKQGGATPTLWRPRSSSDDGGDAPCTHPKGKCK
jgi:uncharacterized membrane protein